MSCLAYCVDKELYKAIDYLKEQIQVLLEQQAKDKKLNLDDNQRRRLARKAKLLSREILNEMTLIFTPATV